VLEAAHALYPDAPVFTSIFAPAVFPQYRGWDIRVSFLDQLPFIHHHHQPFLPLYPLAFESLDLRGFDTIVSITSAFAHGVKIPRGARHICYCLTPARFLWNYADYVQREQIGRVAKIALPLVVGPLRGWDARAARRVNAFIAISRVVQKRIREFYERDSEIIYPPVDVESFPVSAARGDYFLILARLVPYKRIDLAVEAFNQLGLPLVIAGEGRDRARLQNLARGNVRFLGRVADEQARDLLAHARALVFPGEEDFGITPLEANAAGRPVIAFAGGGALDTIREGLNGVFFHAPTSEALAAAVWDFDDARFDAHAIRAYAEGFATRVFQERLARMVDRETGKQGNR
jgi:glycosyltransferase involved in cell wall biosynthesis